MHRQIRLVSVVVASLVVAIAASTGCGGPRRTTEQVRFPDGALRWEYEAESGVPDGVSRTFHPSGALASEGRYVRGLKHGLFKFYSPYGELARRVLFDAGAPIWQTTDPRATPPEALENIVEEAL